MEHGWNGLPFRPISHHYLNLFSDKVYKIPVSIADDCPNRRGLKGMKPCIFCDEWGSAAEADSFSLPLNEQILKYKEKISKRYHAQKFIVYFQAYTNTFLKLQTLQQNFTQALKYEFVHGICIGTRPDCISKAVLALWNATAEQKPLFVELGVQSFDDLTLQFLQRGHSSLDSLNTIEKIHAQCPNVDIGIHLIFGNPNESIDQVIKTAQICNTLPITNIKLHHLHVLKNTPLEQIYLQGEFTPIEFSDYCEKVRVFLEHLSPRFYIHRLAAYSSRWNELISPSWTKNKMQTHQEIVNYLRMKKSYQSKYYVPQDIDEKICRENLYIQSKSTLELNSNF